MPKKQNPDAIRAELDRITQDLHAWAILRNGEYVARVVIRYGGRRSPNGLTVRAFVHVLGLPPVRGIARGGGYDMKSAAVLSAGEHLPTQARGDLTTKQQATAYDIKRLIDCGTTWDRQLEALGYEVRGVI